MRELVNIPCNYACNIFNPIKKVICAIAYNSHITY